MARDMHIEGQERKKGEKKMRQTLAAKTALIGAGAGLVLMAVFGILPGSFIGGVIGLNLAGFLTGFPVAAGLLPRVLVAVFMLLGVLVSALMFIAGGAAAGWVLGQTAGMLAPGTVKTTKA